MKRLLGLSLFLTVLVSGCVKLPDVPGVDVTSLAPRQKKTLGSLIKVNDFPFYSMTYYNDYSEFETVNNELIMSLSGNGSQCSSIAAHGKNPVFGRNHDFTKDPVLILFTRPKNGYASVSMVDMSYLGMPRGKTQFTAEEKGRLLYAPFAPCDGMNEKGLAIGMMARDDEVSLMDTLLGKTVIVNSMGTTLTSSTMIMRKVLDGAASCEEAVEIFRKHRIFFFASLRLHYLVSDRFGKSAVIEYDGDKLVVLYNGNEWQGCTNHGLNGSEKEFHARSAVYWKNNEFARSNVPESLWRYITAEHLLGNSKGEMSMKGAMSILSKVSIETSNIITHRITDWSVVYDQKSGNIDVAVGRDYNNVYRYKLEMKK